MDSADKNPNDEVHRSSPPPVLKYNVAAAKRSITSVPDEVSTESCAGSSSTSHAKACPCGEVAMSKHSVIGGGDATANTARISFSRSL